LQACLANCEQAWPNPEEQAVLFTCKSSCHQDKAIQTRNAADCEPILSLETGVESERTVEAGGRVTEVGDVNEVIHSTCHVEVGVVTNSIGACEEAKTQFLRDDCIKKVAERTGNPSFCAQAQGNLEVQDLSIPIKDICLRVVAKNLNDQSVCDQISDETRREECKENAQSS
jgi:hypothetical protein